MNSPFQDTKIDNKNIKLYNDTPEEELTRNVNPEAQKQIINLKRNAYKSLSPDKSPKSSNNLNSFLLPYSKTSKSQASILITTKQNFLPSISNNLSGIMLNGNRERFNTQGEIGKQQSFVSQFPNTTKAEQNVLFQDNKPRMRTIFSEDKMELDRNTKLGFLKNKYEKTMKNTFCLRNKNQMRSMREISNNRTRQESPERNSNNNSSAYQQQNEQPRNLLGIFLQKKKEGESNQNTMNGLKNIKQLPSPLISTYKYDKIYKMFIEQQQKLAQKEAEKNDNISNQFNCETEKPRNKKTVRSDFRIKTLGNQNEFMDSINTKRSGESEFSNQISPIQQLSYLSFEQKQQQLQQQQQPQKSSQKFFGSHFKSKKEYLTFLNNPLSLQGATINSPQNEQIQQNQQVKQTIFSNNAIKKIFVNSNQASPQKQSFISSDKVSNGSQKDISLEEQQLNLSQELMKKSSFSINMHQSSSQIHKPFGSMTQSTFKRNPSVASEQLRHSDSNGEEQDHNIHKRNYSTKVSTFVDERDVTRGRFVSEDFEEEDLCSPVLNIHIALQNLNDLKLNNEESATEDGSRQLISLKKINQEESRKENDKEKVKKQVDFQIKKNKATIDSDYIANNTDFNSENDDFFNGMSIGRLKSEIVDLDDQNQNDEAHNGKRQLLNQPSIALRTEEVESGLLNEENDQEEEDPHGFVIKKSIDFAQLKELRDKTINRLQSNKQIIHRQESNSNSRNGSQNKFHPLVSPQKNSKFDFASQNSIQPKSARSINKEEKGDAKKSNLRKYFKTGKKKGKGKKDTAEQDLKNQEEKQREQDVKIAEKLDGLKDKLRMTVKVVIRQQIQKKIQSTLSQQILTNIQNNDNNNNNDNQFNNINNEVEDFEQDQEISQIADTIPVNTIQSKQAIQSQPQQQTQQPQSEQQLKLLKSLSNALSPKGSKDNSSKPSLHSKQTSVDKSLKRNPSLNIQVNQNSGSTPKNHSLHTSTSPKSEFANLQSPQKQVGLSKYSSVNNNSQNQNNIFSQNEKRITPLTSPNKKIQNPTYDQQQKEVQEYSAAIMSFFNACVDNMKDDSAGLISHEFQLKHLKNFNENFSQNLVNTFTQEMKNQKMTDEEVERFKYIYEINTKMHIFYKGIVHLLGGVYRLKDLVQAIIKKISSHITLLPVNHIFSPEQMHRRIIPGICALLCDDHKLFYQTLKIFMSINQDEFSFIDFYFIKKYIYSFLTKQKKSEISQELCLLIMQKIESVRRYIFPINVLQDSDMREQVSDKLFKCEKFMELFCPQFKLKHLKNLIDRIYDYFYNDGEDASVLDFNRVRKAIEPFVDGKVSRKIFDYLEQFTQKALQEDPFTLNVILRDLHYKFTKVRLRFGFKQGIFGIIKFNQIPELMSAVREEIDNSVEYGLLSDLDEKEYQKVKETSFLQKYLRFLLCEYDIFSVYDTSVSMSYLGVTIKVFRFWMNSLHTVMLTKYNLQPSKVQIFMRFIEACCPTT